MRRDQETLYIKKAGPVDMDRCVNSLDKKRLDIALSFLVFSSNDIEEGGSDRQQTVERWREGLERDSEDEKKRVCEKGVDARCGCCQGLKVR